MKIKTWLLVTPLLLAAVWLVLPLSDAAGAPSPQVTFQTPTPDLEGKIYYDVQEGDTCMQISLLTGVTTDQLRTLNNLDANCTITTTRLLLGTVAQTPTNTPGPTPTPTPLLPSPTPFNGTAKMCILLFDDVDGDGLHQETEAAIPEGVVNITDQKGKTFTGASSNSTTEPLCYDELNEGVYNISVAIPEGYNPTTVMNYSVTLKAGDLSVLDFGAQASSSAATETTTDGSSRDPIMAILGGLLLVAGAALGVYMVKLKRS